MSVRPNVRRSVRLALSDFTEFVQRAQIVGHGFVLEQLRPLGPGHLAHIDVASRIHAQAMGGHEFGRAQTGAETAKPSDSLAGVV